MSVVGAALRGFGRALKKNKIASKKTPDKSKLSLSQSELKIVTAKAKGAAKLAKDVEENTELFRQGSAFKILLFLLRDFLDIVLSLYVNC